ncbi:hypothetical protein BRC82_06240 [Halobacteriales archaeon QS_1_67_19]|nr:MAG: hypothetical protein BRC82_06240 [Halobacteriales archaeon QS_1_67_19]
MNDQSDDATRPLKYSGPRDRRGGEPPRRRSDGDSRTNPESRSPAERPTGRQRPGESRPSGERSAVRHAPANRPAQGREPLGRETGDDRTGGPGPDAGLREGQPTLDTPIDDDLLDAFAVPDFETDAQKRVYRYVERRGSATDDEIHEHIDLPTEDLAIAIQRLVQRGSLGAHAGTLRVTHGADVEKTYTLRGIDVTVRPAGQADLTDLVALIRTVTDERTYVVAESIAAQLAYEGTVIRHTGARSRLFFVATVDDEAAHSRLVGWTHLTLPGIEYLGHTAELTVGVRPNFRRRGIGTRLVGIALAWAAAHGYRKVHQSLPGTNRAAIDFLGDHGWAIEAVRPDHYRIDGQFVDEVMMAVTL